MKITTAQTSIQRFALIIANTFLFLATEPFD